MVHSQTLYVKSFILVIASLLMLAIALPAFAHGDATTGKVKAKKNVDLTCMQTAVDTREASLLSSFGAFHDDIEEALTTRKDALHSAWGLTSGPDRTKAIGSAWKTWKSDHQNALKTFKTSRKSAWETFKTTVKTSCKETLPKEEALTTDTAGSISI